MKTLKEILNFIVGVFGFVMMAYGADFLGHKWFGEYYFAFIGWIFIVAVMMWQKSMSDNKQKEKDIKIENGKEKVFQSLDELEQTIDKLYRHYEIEKDPAEKLLQIVKKARGNTYDINRKFSSLFFKWEE